MSFDFAKSTFNGASVTSIRLSIGWNGQQSSMVIGTVEDDGETYVSINPAKPITFTLGSLTYRGLIQKTEIRRDFSGFPIQETTVVSPEEILEGTKIIIGSYSGSILPMKNVINTFGYYENLLGFGGARTNETGMPWSLVRTAIHNLTGGGVSALTVAH